MNWSPQQIRNLRLRLGWSLVEFGRHMGGSVKQVQMWESGEMSLTAEAANRFIQLIAQVERNAERLVHQPVAEMVMERDALAQVTHDHILFLRN